MCFLELPIIAKKSKFKFLRTASIWNLGVWKKEYYFGPYFDTEKK